MTTIDIEKLSPADLEKLQSQIKEKEKAEKAKKQQDGNSSDIDHPIPI